MQDLSTKNVFWMLLNGVLVIAMIIGLVGTGALLRYSNATISGRTITVSGEGKTEVAPDIATYSFSMVSQGSDPAKIEQDNTAKMNKAVDFVRAQGIAEKDIKTTGYNLYPRYAYDKDSGSSRIDGYELTRSVTIKIRDLTKVGAILSGLIKTGVNQGNDLRYSVENPEMQRAKARAEAFSQAYEKAYRMATQNNVSLGRVVTFNESTPYPGPIYFEKAYSGVGMGGDVPSMPSGTEEVKVSVSVVYEIR